MRLDIPPPPCSKSAAVNNSNPTLRTLLVSLLLTAGALAQTAPPAAPVKFPPIKVQVMVATKQRNNPNSDYKKDMTIEPKMSIEGLSRMTPIPALDSTLIVVTMDTRAKYKGGAESYQVHTAQTVPLAEAKDGTRRPVEFESSTVTYDTARDSSNLGGFIYKYFVSGVQDAASKEIVDFQTNNATLATFCKTHPEKRAELLGLKKGAKFPADFK